MLKFKTLRKDKTDIAKEMSICLSKSDIFSYAFGARDNVSTLF